VNIARNTEGGFVFSEVDPPLVEMFLSIPASADPEGSKAANERLFPKPVSGQESGVCEEWSEYVKPELREGFENASTTVEGDLGQLFAEGELTIPPGHVDAWLNTLNQARLVLAARFDVTEEDMNRTAPLRTDDERDLALSRIHIYGLLQECLLNGID